MAVDGLTSEGEDRHDRLGWWIYASGVLAAVVAVANLAWGLGSSSLFVDEDASWRAAVVPLGTLFHRVRVFERAPDGYYLLLHAWVQIVGSDSESVMRALSLVAAVGTVASVYWLGWQLAGWKVAAIAALLAAVSPLVLEYGQEVRAYGWAMFAVSLSAAAVVHATRSEPRRLWLALAAAAAAASLWIHYSALLVIAPLIAFVLSSGSFTVRERAGFVTAVLVAGLLDLPLLRDQVHEGAGNAVAGIAGLSASNAERVLGAPFDRTYSLLSGPVTVLSAVLVVLAIGLLLIPGSRVRHPRLLVALASLAPLALLAVTILGHPELISRYDAVAVPFMVIALAASLVRWRTAGLVIVLAALAISATSSVEAHQSAHAYPNTRAAMQLVARHWKTGEVLVPGTGYPGLPYNLQYYATRLLPPHAIIAYQGGSRVLVDLLAQHLISRIAVITEPVDPLETIAANFRRLHYAIIADANIGGTVPMQVFIIERR